MKIVYASRTGHVEILMNKLNINNPTRIMSGDEKVDEDFLLFTYTDGYGDIMYLILKELLLAVIQVMVKLLHNLEIKLVKHIMFLIYIKLKMKEQNKILLQFKKY